MNIDWSALLAGAVINGVVALVIVLWVERWVVPRVQRELAAETLRETERLEAESRAAHEQLSIRVRRDASYTDGIARLRDLVVRVHRFSWRLHTDFPAYGDEARAAQRELQFLLDTARIDAAYLDQLTIQRALVKAYNNLVPALNADRAITELELNDLEGYVTEARRLTNRAYRRSLGLYERRDEPIDEGELAERAHLLEVPPAASE